MTGHVQVRCHLLWHSTDPWDLEQSLFALVAQEGVSLAVTVHAPREQEGPARESIARLQPLAPGMELALATAGAPRVPGDEDALAIWQAGTLATPDHFARCLRALTPGRELAVAPVRRMRLRRQAEGPSFVVEKHWRWTSPSPSLAEVTVDPAFLGRCLVRASAAPAGLPANADAGQDWARTLWAGTAPHRVEGPPSVDLPDLRDPPEETSWQDRAADLRYQLPRRFERIAPLAFQRARRLFHLLRGGGAPDLD